MALFTLGRIVATPGALECLGRSSQIPGDFLQKHLRGEWGDLDAHDAQENQTAL